MHTYIQMIYTYVCPHTRVKCFPVSLLCFTARLLFNGEPFITTVNNVNHMR